MQKEEENKVIDSNIIHDIQHINRSVGGRMLSYDDAVAIASAMSGVRDLSRQMTIAPRHLMQMILGDKDYYGKSYYPCDIIQLRQILEDRKIQCLSKVVLLSNMVAQKVIRSYGAIIILNIDPNKISKQNEYSALTAGGLTIIDSHEIDIENMVHGIIITHGGKYSEVFNIVSDTMPTVPVYERFMVPGVDREKFAISLKDLKKFTINLPAMGIDNQIVKSENEYEAVQECLNRTWHRDPERHLMKSKPARYTAEYWMKSGFWDAITRPDSAYKEASSEGVNIQLTPQEDSIFKTILNISTEMGLGSTFRVAGGWVRDKLLGKESDDIDIAIDNLTGAQFYQAAKQYGQKHPDSLIGKSYTVDMNVDKSKHLETVAVDIGGIKIDFVNLRSESYGSDSRVPTVEFGSPEIDAQRRDLTINAMFYNINNGSIEDYVGGMNDLKTMTLRTPLDPIKTFMDDPLRMLRVLRFNSRYPGSKIEPNAFRAMATPEVHNAYASKVASERAGPEIYKMLLGKQAASAVRALFAVGLDKVVFDVPEIKDLSPLDMDQKNNHHMYNLLEHTLQTVDHLQRICLENKIPEHERALMLFSAIFHDYGKAAPGIAKPKDDDPNQYSYHGHEDVSAIISESIGKKIGFSKKDRDFVNTIVAHHMKPHREPWSNKSIGRWLQNLQIPGQEDRVDTWKYVFWHAEADTMAHGGNQDDELKKKEELRGMFTDYLNRPQPIVMKPLVDGSKLMQMFPNILPKPPAGKQSFIKEIQNRLMDEQLSGNIVDEQQAMQYVESIRGDIENMYGSLPPTQASRWYDLAKIADASSASSPDGYGGYDESALGRDDGIVRMIRRKPGGPSLYSSGDRVRRRNNGISQSQNYGKVTQKKQNTIYVKWDGKDEIESYDLNDIGTMATIERV